MLIVLAFWILFIRNSNVIVVPLCKYRLVADNAVKLSEQSLVLFMDYGQFYLYGDDDGFGRKRTCSNSRWLRALRTVTAQL